MAVTARPLESTEWIDAPARVLQQQRGGCHEEHQAGQHHRRRLGQQRRAGQQVPDTHDHADRGQALQNGEQGRPQPTNATVACAIASSSLVGTTITVTGDPSGEMTLGSDDLTALRVGIDRDAEGLETLEDLAPGRHRRSRRRRR